MKILDRYVWRELLFPFALGIFVFTFLLLIDKIFDLGFPSMISMKAWLATIAFALAIFQLATALWMWGRLPFAGRPKRWVPFVHRWSGTAAFLVSLPVAYHCLWSLGLEFEDGERLLAEVVHDPLGGLRPDALDDAGAEIALEADGGDGGVRREGLDAQVAAVLRVRAPLARHLDQLADVDAGQGADERHQVAAK